VIYLFVLIGSLIGLCALLGMRLTLRNRSVRKFVRGVKKRSDAAVERCGGFEEEVIISRPRKNSRTTMRETQEVSILMRSAEKAFALGKTEEVERLYIQALTVDPDAHQVQAELAKLYLVTDREAKAEALYKELLGTFDDASYHSNLGLAFYKQAKYPKAVAAYKRALDRDAANPERMFALGRAFIAAECFEDAAPLLEKASARLTRNMDLLHMLGECYLQLGHKDHAEDVYRRINKLQPYNEEVKQKLTTLASA